MRAGASGDQMTDVRSPDRSKLDDADPTRATDGTPGHRRGNESFLPSDLELPKGVSIGHPLGSTDVPAGHRRGSDSRPPSDLGSADEDKKGVHSVDNPGADGWARVHLARAIAHAPALGDQRTDVRMFDRSKPDDAERERLAATLGALLRSFRAERRLSTRALAERSTVARSTITRLERGERRPRPGVLAALAYGLDHADPEPLSVALQAAAGESLRPDTPQGARRRSRRLGRAQREMNALRDEVGREAGRARVAARRLAIAGARAFPIPPPGNLSAAQLGRLEAELARAEAIVDESHRSSLRADRLAGTLAWPYHPLERGPLERCLEA